MQPDVELAETRWGKPIEWRKESIVEINRVAKLIIAQSRLTPVGKGSHSPSLLTIRRKDVPKTVVWSF